MHDRSSAATDLRLTRHLATEAETLDLGIRLGHTLTPGLVIYLHGELGAGKTTLARGILRGLGYPGKVKSPTYTLVELYKVSRLYLYHFDFYRLEDPLGWIDAGFREHFTSANVCMVEWPEKARGTLPAADIEVHLAIVADERDIELVAHTDAGRQCLTQLAARYLSTKE